MTSPNPEEARPRARRRLAWAASAVAATGVLAGIGIVLTGATGPGATVEAAAAARRPATTASVPPTSTTPLTVPPAPPPPAPTTTAAPAWVVGATPLPLRPDGFGQVLPTPPVLVDRRLPTGSARPAPPRDEFEAAISPLSDEVVARMGRTWQPGCPVGLEELRYVTVTFWGFDGQHHTGELVVHRDVAEQVVQVFCELHRARFPIEEMRLVTDADLDAAPTGDGNNTAAFVCRPVRGGSSWSAHAYGKAVDVNPFHNPYRRGDLVLPELASAYLDRGDVRPGMVVDGDVVTRAFEAVGWHWGGRWRSPDWMHFSASGR